MSHTTRWSLVGALALVTAIAVLCSSPSEHASPDAVSRALPGTGEATRAPVPLLERPRADAPLVGPSLRGVVVDANDRPVASATVTVRSMEGLGAHPPEYVAETTTDVDGVFTLDPPPGRHRAMALRAGRVSGLAEIDVRAAQTAHARLVLASPAIHVHARDAGGAALAGVRVRLRPEGVTATRPEHMGWTDAVGDLLVPVDAGGWTIRVDWGDHALLDRSPVVVTDAPAIVDATVFLVPAGAIEGDVVDAEGLPVPDVTVTLIETGSADPASVTVETDAAGCFSVPDLARSSTWLVSASRTVYGLREASASVGATAGGDIVRLTLLPVPTTRRVVIEVVAREDGRPVPTFAVRSPHDGTWRREVHETARGQADIELDLRAHRIQVAADGYASQWVEIREERVRVLLGRASVPAGNARIQVLAPDGAPAADVLVNAMNVTSEPRSILTEEDLRSDEHGVVVLELAPGTWVVMARDEAQEHFGFVGPITVEGSEPIDATVELLAMEEFLARLRR